MNDPTVEFCRELGRVLHDISLILQDHINDNDEILPHVFMGDVTRYVVSGGPERKEVVSRLNKGLAEGSDDIQHVIAASFVENIESEADLEQALRGADGGAIRAEWHRQRNS